MVNVQFPFFFVSLKRFLLVKENLQGCPSCRDSLNIMDGVSTLGNAIML